MDGREIDSLGRTLKTIQVLSKWPLFKLHIQSKKQAMELFVLLLVNGPLTYPYSKKVELIEVSILLIGEPRF